MPSSSRTAPNPSLSTVAPTSVSPPPVSTRLVLSEDTIRSGQAISGTVVVENNTSSPLPITNCDLDFQVLLVNDSYYPMPGWAGPGCARDTLPVGRSSYKVSIEAKYNVCTAAHSALGQPVCEEGGDPPPLPAGRYEATTYEGGLDIPVPQPVPITVMQ